MREVKSVPYAPSLIESMRSLGYSFESAIADIIDNSISAEANNIDIKIDSSNKPYLVVIDDGHGMNNDELYEAMRYGSQNPLDIRDEKDLGRFGLGLKSASLSQCRQLTVVSKKDNSLSSYRWDLDFVISEKDWKLQELEFNEFKTLPCIQDLINSSKNGTYVLWSNFDRLKKSSHSVETALVDMMSITIDHLSLVYHRYINDGLNIRVNNRELKKIDPFLKKHKKTTLRREKTINIDGQKIYVKPYVLPHKTNLTESDYELMGGKESLYTGQGFYIYRNKRLIIWGTWFRLEVRNELGKLARIQVDIPNTLDEIWNIDIKKNTASLPYTVRNQLVSSISDSVGTSKTRNEFRGKRPQISNKQFVWERTQGRENYYYTINRDLPQLKILTQELDDKCLTILNSLLTQLENNIPVESIYVDNAKDEIKKYEPEIELLIEEVNEIFYTIKNSHDLKVEELMPIYSTLEPYCNYNEVVIHIKELLENE